MNTGLDEIKAALQNNDQALAAEKTKEYLQKLENVPLNIAVTGECGSGKSSFVNALRGLENRHDDAAPTGSVEPTEYTHPDLPNVKIWDLPGVGTSTFTADKYLEDVGFENYDFFIIVSSDRFRENDAKLAKEIQKMKKKFYFVRSKMDNNMKDEARSQKNFDKEKTLKRIRDNCIQELQELGIESPQVFLVSSFDLGQYDFEDLSETLKKDLPEHKRDVLFQGLPVTSLKVLEEKIESLKSSIIWYAMSSAAGAAVPLPGLSLSADVALILTFVKMCQKSLGLTEGALLRLSDATGVSIDDIRAELKSPFTEVTVTPELLTSVLSGCVKEVVLIALKEESRLSPFFRISVAMGLSYYSILKLLKQILETIAEDARRVFTKAMKPSPSES